MLLLLLYKISYKSGISHPDKVGRVVSQVKLLLSYFFFLPLHLKEFPANEGLGLVLVFKLFLHQPNPSNPVKAKRSGSERQRSNGTAASCLQAVWQIKCQPEE